MTTSKRKPSSASRPARACALLPRAIGSTTRQFRGWRGRPNELHPPARAYRFGKPRSTASTASLQFRTKPKRRPHGRDDTEGLERSGNSEAGLVAAVARFEPVAYGGADAGRGRCGPEAMLGFRLGHRFGHQGLL